MTYWAELVELYEYRVADVLEGRSPRGGKRSLAELRATLLDAALEPALHRRLMEADRRHRAHGKGEDPDAARAPALPSLSAAPGWTAPATGDSAEARAWEELRRLAWQAGVRGRLLDLTAALGREPGRLSLRALYAAVENAGRLERGVPQPLAVPAAADSLVSLHDPGVVRDLTLELAGHLLTPEGRTRLRGALSAVHDEPFPRHEDADVLDARLQAAEREPLSPEARTSLVQALRAPYPEVRDPRERPAIRGAVRELQRSLDALLQDAPGPTLGVTPAGSVLYAADPQAALAAPDDGAGELTVNLGGGQAARWRGLDLRWQPVGPNWQLQVTAPGRGGPAGGQVALLQPHLPPEERALTLETPGGPVHLFLSGAYLLLRAEAETGEALGHLASRARAVARLLDPGASYANLRLARAAAQFLREGRVDTEAHGPASTGRYAGAPADTLLAFARRGVEALAARLADLSPAEADSALRASAARLGLPQERARSLHEVLHAAAFTPETLPGPQPGRRAELPPGGAYVTLPLDDEPLTLLAGARAVTLRRDYRGELAAVLPGQPAAGLHDLLVLGLPGAQMLLVRQGPRLAAALQPLPEGDPPLLS